MFMRRRRVRLTLLTAILLGTCAAVPALAHPHVWVTVEATVLVNDQHQITGLKQRWTFDKGYSQYSLEGLEQDAAGNYTPAAFVALAKENMDSLKDYNYFTEFDSDGIKLDLGSPQDPAADRDDRTIMHLTFTLPLKKPLAAGAGRVTLQVFDPEFYIALTFAQTNPIQFSRGAGCTTKLEAPTGDPNTSKSWGAAYAQTAVIACGG